MTNSDSVLIDNALSRKSQTYVIITAFFALLAIVGFVIYGLPFFYNFYMKEFGWSKPVVTSGNFIGKLLVAPLFGFIAGWFVDRYGPRKMMITGILMTGIAVIGLSMMNSQGVFYLCYILVALGYVFGGPLPCQVLISRWFKGNRGKAMGIAYLGIGMGGALVPLIATVLERNIGWHFALALIGGLIILIALPFSVFVRNSPAAGQVSIKTEPEPVAPIKGILMNPWFYMLAIGSMCSIGAVGGINQHLKLYLLEIKFTESQAAHVMSLVLFMSLAGRLLMGWLADMIPRKYVMILIYLIVGGSIPLLLLPDFQGRIYLFAVIFGIGLGGDYMIIPLMAGDIFGVRTLGRVMGIIIVADGVAEATLPWLVSFLYKSAQSYSPGFIVLIGIALIGAFVVSFLPRRSKETLSVTI